MAFNITMLCNLVLVNDNTELKRKIREMEGEAMYLEVSNLKKSYGARKPGVCLPVLQPCPQSYGKGKYSSMRIYFRASPESCRPSLHAGTD